MGAQLMTLGELAESKSALCERIAARREAIADVMVQVEAPLRFADEVRERWQRIPSFFKLVAVPMLMMLKRSLLPGRKIFRPSLQLLPVLFEIGRVLLGARRRA